MNDISKTLSQESYHNNHAVGSHGGVGIARSISQQDRCIPVPPHPHPTSAALSGDAHQGLTHHGVQDDGLFSADNPKAR